MLFIGQSNNIKGLLSPILGTYVQCCYAQVIDINIVISNKAILYVAATNFHRFVAGVWDRLRSPCAGA